ncbi:MAG: hypothetical protein KDD62_15260, partial [Bdellovibrionales bacterium]|nr:hypothetical protein [Bdellovibrionales bacterium]
YLTPSLIGRHRETLIDYSLPAQFAIEQGRPDLGYSLFLSGGRVSNLVRLNLSDEEKIKVLERTDDCHQNCSAYLLSEALRLYEQQRYEQAQVFANAEYPHADLNKQLLSKMLPNYDETMAQHWTPKFENTFKHLTPSHFYVLDRYYGVNPDLHDSKRAPIFFN